MLASKRYSTSTCHHASTHVQGYYRRADASMVLGKHKDAVRDFQKAAKGAKSDPDLKRKLSACQKELQRQRFAKAVSRVPPALWLSAYPSTVPPHFLPAQ